MNNPDRKAVGIGLPNRPISRWRTQLLRWWLSYQWPVVWGLALAALVLGYVGFKKNCLALGEKRSLWDFLYLSLQLFVLQSGAPAPPVGWELNAARWIAPLAAGYAAVQALARIFSEELRSFRLRFLKDHVVICGLGRKGLQLAKDFRGEGFRVVVLEGDGGNTFISECRDTGATVVVDPATEGNLLHKALISRARYLIAACGTDGANAEIAVIARRIIRRRKTPSGRKLRCFVHIVDVKLCELFKQNQILAAAADPCEVRFFNLYENSARLLFRDHPPDRGLIREKDRRAAHLIVLGFGQMGESVALQAAKIGHYANLKKVHITVVDREASKKQHVFYHRYPGFDRICETVFLGEDLEDPDFINKIPHWGDSRDFITTVVVCLDDDSRSLSCALSLVPKPGQCRFPILVRMAQKAGLAALLREKEGDSGWGACLEIFGRIDRACTREIILHEGLDLLARKLHEHYVRERIKEGQVPGTNPALTAWDELDESYKESNRQAADHIPVKLRAIGCSSASSEERQIPVAEFEPEEVELLARMEHSRFVAERLLSGWIWGPGKDLEKKISPSLVEWEKLSDNVRDYDRKIVREIPGLLAQLGHQIYRRSAK